MSRNFPGAGAWWLGGEWGELWEVSVTFTCGLERLMTAVIVRVALP